MKDGTSVSQVVHTVRSRRLLLVLSLILPVLTGCYETRQEITLNPDGSGRAVLTSTCNFGPFDSQIEDTNDVAETFVRQLMEEAEGVEAWNDVTCQELEDGRLSVRATAYFSDLSRFKTRLNGIVRFQVSRDKDGLFVISPKADKSRSPVAIPAEPKPETPASLALERRKFRAFQPLMTAVLGSLKLETSLKLPGPVRSASNFETNGNGGWKLKFDGARLMSAIEHALSDPEIARARIDGKLREDLIESHYANRLIYGQAAPVRIECKPGSQPQFDYAAEVAAARRAFPAIAKKFGLPNDLPQARTAAVDGMPARVRVIGIDWRFDEPKPFVRHAAWGDRGYRLRLQALLPGTVLGVSAIKVTRAASLEGPNLQASASSYLRIPEQTSSNWTFDISIDQPAPRSGGWAEIAGVLECSSAENLRTVELFNGPLKMGTRGTEYGAQIESIGSSVRGGDKLVFTTDVPVERLLWVKVVSGGGQAVELERRNWMKVGDNQSYTYSSSRTIPRDGRVTAGILVGEKLIRIPFALTNVNLIGQPLAAR